MTASDRAVRPHPDDELIAVVRAGLRTSPRSLPPWLFYDARGSELFTAITELPEYYPTRAERAIFATAGEALIDQAAGGRPLTIVELGAGTADKTRVLLAPWAARGGGTYVPIDVSVDALTVAQDRLTAELPGLRVVPRVGRNEEARTLLAELDGPGRRLVLFIGSSIGNYERDDAIRLLRTVRAGLTAGDALLLGTDLRKSIAVLLPAYDDARGVTAAFNRNLLVRLNRELGADFVPERFRHVALWNQDQSRIEMHLESEIDQRVRIPRANLDLWFVAGERIHTESSVKYDLAMVDELLTAAGFVRERTETDDEGRFAVHLARVPGVRGA